MTVTLVQIKEHPLLKSNFHTTGNRPPELVNENHENYDNDTMYLNQKT